MESLSLSQSSSYRPLSLYGFSHVSPQKSQQGQDVGSESFKSLHLLHLHTSQLGTGPSKPKSLQITTSKWLFNFVILAGNHRHQNQTQQRCWKWEKLRKLRTHYWKVVLPFLFVLLSSISGRDITSVSRAVCQRVWSISVAHIGFPRSPIAPLQNPFLNNAWAHTVWYHTLCQKPCAEVLILKLIPFEQIPEGKAVIMGRKEESHV